MNTENHRTLLIKADTVRHFTRLGLNEIRERADGDSLFGGFIWVWNVAADPDGEMRDLRFWAREIVAPETVKGWSLDRVIKSILPTKRSQYAAGEVRDTVLGLSGQALMRLRSELNGQLAANSSFFPREGIENFLRDRWLGANRVAAGRAA
jgi:hypothetical protein